MDLFADSENEQEAADEENWWKNNKNREEYNQRKNAEALQRAKERGIDVDEDDEESSDDDSDGEHLTQKVEVDILNTIRAIRTKDPKIYDSKHKFFDPDEEEGKEDADGKKAKKKKPYQLKDFLRDQVLEGGAEDEEDAPKQKKVMSHEEEMQALKADFLKSFDDAGVDEDDGDDDEAGLKKRKKSKKESEAEEEQFQEWQKTRKDKIGKGGKKVTEEDIMARFYGDVDQLDENDKFLWNYVSNDGWIDEEKKESGHATYEELVESDDSDQQADNFEAAYNFRFEDPEGNTIVTHPRNIEGSVRNTKDKRKQKRKERNERKEAELTSKRDELKRLKNMKKQEIAAKLKQISDATGIAPEGLEDVDLDGDFDPEEYDKRMAKAFGGDFYENDEKPEDTEAFLASVRKEIEEEGYDAEVGWEGDGEGQTGDWKLPDGEEEAEEEQAGAGDEEEEEAEQGGDDDQHEEDDEEADWDAEGTKQKREHRRKKGSKKGHVDMGEYLDEYYKLDFEDVVGGMGTRFKYKEVAPVDFGMDPVEILLMDDKKLNRYAGLKKYAAYREDAAHLPKQFNKRRWDYFKKHEGFEKELDGAYEEMSKKKGPSKGSKGGSKDDKGKGKKKRERSSSKRKRGDADDDAGEGPSTEMPEWKKKQQKQQQKKKDKSKKKDAGATDAVDGGNIAADRLASYTASTKRSKKK